MTEPHQPHPQWVAHIGRSGAVAAVGTIITAVAYGAVSITSDSVLGSYTATEVASQYPSMRSLVGLQFVPFTLLIMGGGALWLLLRQWATLYRSGIAVAILVAAGLTMIAYVAPYPSLNRDFNQAETGISPVSLSGPGLWLALIGALITAAGAIIELRTSATNTDPVE